MQRAPCGKALVFRSVASAAKPSLLACPSSCRASSGLGSSSAAERLPSRGRGNHASPRVHLRKALLALTVVLWQTRSKHVDAEDWRMSFIPVRVIAFATLVAAASCSPSRPPATDTTSAAPAGTPSQAPTPAVQPPTTSVAHALDTTVSWRRISFHVMARGDTLTIEPKGLAIDNRRIDETIVGLPVKAEVGDLNNDNWPELLVYFVSQDSMRRGDLIGYSSNAGKPVSQLYFYRIP